MSQKPIVRLTLALDDELQSKSVRVVVVLEGVLVGEQLSTLPPDELYIIEEVLAVLIHPSHKLLSLLLHFALKIFHYSFNLDLYLHL